MKKLVFVLLLVFICFCSCTQQFLGSRKIHIVIPQHSWESGSGVRLWYNLKWNDKGQIKTLYVDQETREIDIDISRNGTVFICAYPLGEMLPFGASVTPVDGNCEVILNQSEGYIAHLLINIGLDVAEQVNFSSLMEKINGQTDDSRTVDDTVLLADILNGRLRGETVKIRKKYRVDSISIPNGKWISEFGYDGSLYVDNGQTGELILSPGVFRYYCYELDREFRIVVDENGGVFHSLRYGMIGL